MRADPYCFGRNARVLSAAASSVSIVRMMAVGLGVSRRVSTSSISRCILDVSLSHVSHDAGRRGEASD